MPCGALFGLRAGGNGEGHGERKRDDADGGAGDDVREPMAAAEQSLAVGFDDREPVRTGALAHRR
jgi:hypothetical protein